MEPNAETNVKYFTFISKEIASPIQQNFPTWDTVENLGFSDSWSSSNPICQQ